MKSTKMHDNIETMKTLTKRVGNDKGEGWNNLNIKIKKQRYYIEYYRNGKCYRNRK